MNKTVYLYILICMFTYLSTIFVYRLCGVDGRMDCVLAINYPCTGRCQQFVFSNPAIKERCPRDRVYVYGGDLNEPF